jgi:hypothetical protein
VNHNYAFVLLTLARPKGRTRVPVVAKADAAKGSNQGWKSYQGSNNIIGKEYALLSSFYVHNED